MAKGLWVDGRENECCWLLVVGCWLLVGLADALVKCWLVGVRCSLFVVCCLFAVRCSLLLAAVDHELVGFACCDSGKQASLAWLRIH